MLTAAAVAELSDIIFLSLPDCERSLERVGLHLDWNRIDEAMQQPDRSRQDLVRLIASMLPADWSQHRLAASKICALLHARNGTDAAQRNGWSLRDLLLLLQERDGGPMALLSLWQALEEYWTASHSGNAAAVAALHRQTYQNWQKRHSAELCPPKESSPSCQSLNNR